MTLRSSSQGQDHVDAVNAMAESRARLSTWVALSEAFVLLLARSGVNEWMYGPPHAAFRLLTERLNAVPVPGEGPWPETTGAQIVAAMNRTARNSSGDFLDDEVAASTPEGARLVARAKRALPVVSSYESILMADNNNEVQDDFHATWARINAWRAADRSPKALAKAGTAEQKAPAAVSEDEVTLLLERIERELPRSSWPRWPGGWPEEIEAAVLDSVFSGRAKYGSQTTGVRAVVKRFRYHRQRAIDDLRVLARYVEDPGDLSRILGNRQQLGGRAKSETAAAAASALLGAGVRHAIDVTGSDEERKAWCSVKGLADVTWSYFLMLLGVPGVKADVMVRRFVDAAVGRTTSAPEAKELVEAVAERLDVSATDLDHAIWSWQRAQED